MGPPKVANRGPMPAMPAMPVILFGGDPSKTSLEEYRHRRHRRHRLDLPLFWMSFLSTFVELTLKTNKNDLPKLDKK